MTERIPQHIILDLLPLYIEGEVSSETHGLIEEYLKQDPQLAKLVEQAKIAPSLQEIPAPLKKENEMEALKKVKKLMIQHNVFLGLAALTTFLTVPAYISFHEEIPAAPMMMAGIALIFWIAFFLVNMKISE